MREGGIFVTGTDTSVGKTMVTCALLRAFGLRGRRVLGMKPVATGGRPDRRGCINDDVTALIAASNVRAPIQMVNPYCFEPPIAPHIAAQRAGVRISLARIRQRYRALKSRADVVIVEGAGGLLVPLGPRSDWCDVAGALGIPVVLVVGMRLGCLNHALLTAQALDHRQLPVAGWVANRIDPHMPFFDENLFALRRRLAAPLIGIMPFAPDAQRACSALDIDLLSNLQR